MRVSMLIIGAAFFAAPATAQPAQHEMEIPKELLDPALADTLSDALEALSKSMLDLPIGEVQAAVEGRDPTAADKRRTVRSETGMSEREVKQQIEAARPQMRAAMKAMASALPAMLRGLSEAGRELEKATANLPQPGYPRR